MRAAAQTIPPPTDSAAALSFYLAHVLGRARQRAAAVEAALRLYIAERTRAEEALRESEETLRWCWRARTISS